MSAATVASRTATFAPVAGKAATAPQQSHRAELAEFAARACYTLWHGAGMISACSEFSPRTLFYETPESFRLLVGRTLHPHLSAHIATVALLYVQRYINAQISESPLAAASVPTPPASPPYACDYDSRPGPGSEARIWCVALSLAIKEHDDRAAAARHWAPARVDEAAGGMTALELAAMEREFLEGIDWRLRITPEEYAGWLQRLRKFKAVMESSAPVKVQYNMPSPTASPPVADDRKRSIEDAGLDRSRNVMSVASLIDHSPTATIQPPRKRSTTSIDVADRFGYAGVEMTRDPPVTVIRPSPSNSWSSPESSDSGSTTSEE
jgi:hypothetical protein